MLRLLALLLALCAPLWPEELRIAVLGNFPEYKGLETLAAQEAVDGANASDTRRHGKVRLVVHHDRGTVEGALEAAGRIVDTPNILGVVVHGEAGVDPAVLKVFEGASLAVVAASSWANPRSNTAGVTWLSPSALQLAEVAATYARKGKKARQVAVLDNGAPTSQAAARAFAARFKELGGRVDVEKSWIQGDSELTRTAKALSANWPQVIFFAGEGQAGGELIKTLRKEGESLKETTLLGMPTFFDPGFFNTARVISTHSAVVFPHPEYSPGRFAKFMGITFPKGSPAYKAYISRANRPGRWGGMVFDGVKLVLDAFERAAGSAGPESEAGALSPTAEALSATAASLPGLSRAAVKKSLLEIENYRGIRGKVAFSPSREPSEAKAMVFYAIRSVKKSKEMKWYNRQYGPPFTE